MFNKLVFRDLAYECAVMKILLVDDDKLDRVVITKTLRQSNLEVTVVEAVTVDEGLKYYEEEDFDIILLDYSMPQRDGIEMIVEIRNEFKTTTTAIVMMSSSANESLAIDCIKAGAQDFLIKSEISEERLRRALLHATTRFELENQLYQTYQKVKLLAETDSLTGLPNRYFFDESLKQAIASNKRSERNLALLLLDLDNFKLINDNFGHDIGDVLLKRTVMRIRGCLRGNELLSRLGGDEFAITLSDLDTNEHASLVASRIIRVMQKPIDIAGTTINTTASIGIALHPDNGSCSEELFKYADIAMYRAKKQGRNQVCFFAEEMQQKFYHRLLIETELRVAIEKKQLLLHYQPVVDPNSGSVKGFEALIRWLIDGNMRTPDEFIDIAEKTQQITQIGAWVIEEAIASLSQWNEQRLEPYCMAINVSAVQLGNDLFLKVLRRCLNQYKVPAYLIEIELTETALFKDTPATRKSILGLTDLGCHLSLDDFGTGYSSIAHLRNYPISVVKIDRSLMPLKEDSIKDTALVEGVVSMASILGLGVIAEGVETQEHVNLCRDLNISRVQGYYFSKPLSKEMVTKLYT